MEIKGDNDRTFERTFGHCILSWKIENYCLATCEKEWVIESAEFHVRGVEATKWKMSLCCKPKVLEMSRVELCLERLYCHAEPDVVWANWKICLLDGRGNAYSSAEHACFFKRKSNYSLDLENADYIVNRIRPFDVDVLRIRCQLIVHQECITKAFEKAKDAGLRSLSQDMKVLYKRGKYHDIVFRINGRDIRAHKSILKSRNRCLVDIITEESEEVIELTIVDYEAMEKVVAYLYTGNLEYVLGKPSILLYDCVMCLDIEELKSYYIPDELIIHTTIDVEEFVFLWLITDFSTRNEDCLAIPVFNTDICETACNLRLYPKGIGDELQHVSVFAEVAEKSRPFALCLDFAIMDTNKEFFCLRRIRKHAEGSESLGFREFVKIDYLANSSLLADDTLRVVFKYRTSNGNATASFGNRMMSAVSYKTKRQRYDSLSMDLLNMFETGRFCDFSLTAEGESFGVHKCIVAARSRIISSIINQMGEDETEIAIPNVTPQTLGILISYLYSGVLKDFEMNDACEIYEAAETFAMPHLKDAMSRALQANLEVKSVSEYLVFAESRRDHQLKLSALKFVCLNAEEVYDQLNWKTLRLVKPSLGDEVIEFVNKNRGKFKP